MDQRASGDDAGLPAAAPLRQIALDDREFERFVEGVAISCRRARDAEGLRNPIVIDLLSIAREVVAAIERIAACEVAVPRSLANPPFGTPPSEAEVANSCHAYPRFISRDAMDTVMQRLLEATA